MDALLWVRMEIHRELFGLRVDVTPSLGEDILYVVLNPYGCRGMMVGCNIIPSHSVSVTVDGDERGDYNDYFIN